MKFDEVVRQVRDILSKMHSSMAVDNPSALELYEFTYQIETKAGGILRILIEKK